MSAFQMERREFLKFSVAASGGLLIGVYLSGASKLAVADERSGSGFRPNAFLRIGTDERVTVIVNHSEMGQGVYTALPMLLADELDADWSKVGYESAPVDPKYNHPVFGMQVTGGSSSVWSGFEQYRNAGAAARTMLIAAAAQQWKADPATLRTESGVVLDVKNPGMLTAVVARAPVFGAKLKSFDDSQARNMAGVRKVVAVPSGVAVVAESFWQAKVA